VTAFALVEIPELLQIVVGGMAKAGTAGPLTRDAAVFRAEARSLLQASGGSVTVTFGPEGFGGPPNVIRLSVSCRLGSESWTST
jgi:hypothetical protein